MAEITKERIQKAIKAYNLSEDKERIRELKSKLNVAKKIIQNMLRDIPNRMWYTDATTKEAEEFLKEDYS